MRIYTITLNPVYDYHFTLKNFNLKTQNYVDKCIVSAGGKGVNISRALEYNSIKSKAYLALGKENSQSFEAILKNDNLNYEKIEVDGFIRQNIIIHSENNGETRLSEDNFSLTKEHLEMLYQKILPNLSKDSILAFSGRIPKGLRKDDVFDFFKKIKTTNALLSVDSNSFDLNDLKEIKPWLIKPNDQEISELFGKEIKDPIDALPYAQKLCEYGIANVFITLAEKGAAFASKDFMTILNSPKIKPLSTVGAGDSTIAGFIGAFSQGLSLKKCLKTAMAFGSAACLTEGTLPPMPQDIEMLLGEIETN